MILIIISKKFNLLQISGISNERDLFSCGIINSEKLIYNNDYFENKEIIVLKIKLKIYRSFIFRICVKFRFIIQILKFIILFFKQVYFNFSIIVVTFLSIYLICFLCEIYSELNIFIDEIELNDYLKKSFNVNDVLNRISVNSNSDENNLFLRSNKIKGIRGFSFVSMELMKNKCVEKCELEINGKVDAIFIVDNKNNSKKFLKKNEFGNLNDSSFFEIKYSEGSLIIYRQLDGGNILNVK